MRKLQWVGVVLVAGLVGLVIGGRWPLPWSRAADVRAATVPSAASAPGGMALPSGPGVLLADSDVWVVRPQTLTRSLRVSGTLKAVDTALVKAKVAAEVKSLSVREGDAVKAGQVIGQLDTTELELRLRQAEQAAATSRAQADIARRTLDNNRALVAQGFISATGLETSVSNDAAAQATYQSALAAAALARKGRDDAVLRAPMAGRISQRLVQPGERVPLDARLVEIVDLRRMELEASLPPEDVEQVRLGQTARLQVDGVGEPLRAEVVRVNPSTQAGTRSVLVYLALRWERPGEPPLAVRQGQFAQGSIELERQDALAVPVDLVQMEPGPEPRGQVLALVDGRVRRTSVQLGAQGEIMGAGNERQSAVVVRRGLSEGMVLLRPSVGQLSDGTLATWRADAPAAPTRTPPSTEAKAGATTASPPSPR
ncbi:MAG: efflux RND transporter periplasmic adaptor subunit [Pseudomonadota bacterium]